jgi:hypothetical protein
MSLAAEWSKSAPMIEAHPATTKRRSETTIEK